MDRIGLSTPCTFIIDNDAIATAKTHAAHLDAALPSRFKYVSDMCPTATIVDVVVRSLEQPNPQYNIRHYEFVGTEALVARVLQPLQDEAKKEATSAAAAGDEKVGEATRLLEELHPTIEALLRLLVADSVRHMKLAWKFEKKVLMAERQMKKVGSNERKSRPSNYECARFLNDLLRGVEFGVVPAKQLQAIFTASISFQRLLYPHLSKCLHADDSAGDQPPSFLRTEWGSFSTAGSTALVCAQSFEQRLAVMELFLTCSPVGCVDTSGASLSENTNFFDFYTELLAMSHTQILERFPVRNCADTTALAASERRLSNLASQDPSDIPSKLLEANGPILLATDDEAGANATHHALSVHDLFWALAQTSTDLFHNWIQRGKNIMNPEYPHTRTIYAPPMMKLLAKLLPLVPVHDWDSLPPLAHHRYTLANDPQFHRRNMEPKYLSERINDILDFIKHQLFSKKGKINVRVRASCIHLIQHSGRHQRSLDFWLVRWRLQCIRGVCNDVVAVMLEFLVGPLTFPAQFIRKLKISNDNDNDDPDDH